MNPTPVRLAAVFEKKNSLPGSELDFSIDNRHCFAGAGQDHANVRGHIVRSFIVVFVVGVFGDQFLEKSFDVAARRRRCVLHHGQAATRVLDENRRDPVPHARFVDLILDVIGNFVSRFAVGSDLELAMMNVHRGHGIQSRPDQQGAAASKPPTG